MALTETQPSRFTPIMLAGVMGLAITGQAQAASLAERFAPRGALEAKHGDFSELLSRFVIKGADGLNRVDYRGLKASRGKLSAYLARMQAIDAASLAPQAAKAYWINLYNAKTLDVVLDRYPVKSIRDINLGGGFLAKGPWKKKLLKVSGVDLSLDDIEHKIARKIWKDPRLHYGFNCASVGCPNLGTKAYGAKGLNQQLDQAARDYINHPRGVSATASGLQISKIYDWYEEDFGTKAQLKAHWKRYANADLASKLNQISTIKGYSYNWSLNDKR